MYWYCKRTNPSETRSPACVAIAAPEAPSMLSSRVNSIEADKYSASGWETVGSQGPVGTQGMGSRNEMQYAFASALLDQLEENGTDVREHHRRLRIRQYSALPQIEAKPSTMIQAV